MATRHLFARRGALIAPVWQATVDIIFVSVDLSPFCHARLDNGLDRRLLNIGKHAKKDLPTSLDHSEDGWLLLFKSAAARRSLEASAPAWTAFFWVAAGLPLWPATT